MGRFTLSFFLALFLVGISVLPTGGGNKGCKGCHRDIYNQAINYPFSHSPVKDDCAKCHIVRGSSRKAPGKSRQFLLRGYYREGLFPLEGLSLKDIYEIEVVVRDRKGRKSLPSLLTLTPSEIGDVLEDDKTPPVINDIFVEEIKPGVFVEADIKWETNKPTVFKIEYGFSTEYGEHMLGERVFVKKHEALLTGLRHNKIYHYRIVSTDIFGNSTISIDHTLDTSKPKEKGTDLDKMIEGTSIPSIENLKPFMAEDGSIYLSINSSMPSRVSLKLAYGKKKTKIEKHGSGLAPKRFSGIDACIKCHRQGASHPVGVPPRAPNTIIPDTLPTGEGGVITCTTCHLPHGGMVKFLARFDFKRDICVLCHKDL